VFAEMALAGVTTVGEFHYLHHRPEGEPYADPNAMGHAVVEAAAAAGVRLTLLDACYLRGGFDRPLESRQLRFGDGDAGMWLDRVAALDDALGADSTTSTTSTSSTARVGAAIHSVRAVDPASMAVIAEAARDHRWPLHLHLSEQEAENHACLAATGRSPTHLAADSGVLGPTTTAVHATHVSAGDIATLGRSGTGVCLCPTTERDLGDGIGPADALAGSGCPLSLGLDSNAVIDLFEEARAVELGERLATHRRGLNDPAALLVAATVGGVEALGWARDVADVIAIDVDGPRLAGGPTAGDDATAVAAGVVFAATAADVTTVVVGGEVIVRDREHLGLGDVGRLLADSVGGLWS
jgi:formiminoglutamate deiminase